jgi:fatty-acyl-CoA synthase
LSNHLQLTIGELLDQVSERLPNKEGMVYADRAVRYTYRELQQAADQVAKALIGMGIKKGRKLHSGRQTFPSGYCFSWVARRWGLSWSR